MSVEIDTTAKTDTAKTVVLERLPLPPPLLVSVLCVGGTLGKYTENYDF